MSEEQEQDKNLENKEQENKKLECPVCGNGLAFISDPNSGKLISIRCKTYKYDRTEKKNIGCNYVVYSSSDRLKNRVLTKSQLKKITAGETLRINNLSVFIDIENPTIAPNKKKVLTTYYLKIERDEDLEEDV